MGKLTINTGIKNLFKKSLFCSISTITSDGLPHCSPIGSVVLRDNTGGYFIEMFTKSFKNQEGNKAVIMVVNSSLIFWLKSLVQGRFDSPPATRLLVTLHARREIKEDESALFKRRVNIFKRLKGHKLMWSSANFVRPYTIDKIIPVSLGKMTKHLES